MTRQLVIDIITVTLMVLLGAGVLGAWYRIVYPPDDRKGEDA